LRLQPILDLKDISRKSGNFCYLDKQGVLLFGKEGCSYPKASNFSVLRNRNNHLGASRLALETEISLSLFSKLF
jgi:hypothetical protein